jgi:tetratricopeptide (TPR) repeat protein
MFEQARRLYEQRAYAELVDLLGALDLQELLRQPQLGFFLADAQRRLGHTQAALELAIALRGPARRAGIPRLELDLLNLEGMLRFETGSVAGAEQCWRELLNEASRHALEEFVARANNNLGIIYTVQARPVEAISCYERAIAAYRTLGMRRGIAQSCQNLAITYRELGRSDEADEHFVSALDYAKQDGSTDEMARAEQERALGIYLARRDARLARLTAQRALERFEQLKDPVGTGDTLRVLAMIELGEGNLDSAQQHVARALEKARATGHQFLEAEAQEVAAAIYQRRGDAAAADAARSVATSLFQQLRVEAWGNAFRERVAQLV